MAVSVRSVDRESFQIRPSRVTKQRQTNAFEVRTGAHISDAIIL